MPLEQIPPTADPLAELPQKRVVDLTSVLRAIRDGDIDRIARPIHDAARAKLRTRGARKAGHTMDVTKVVEKTPKGGSQNVNLRGVLTWINEIDVTDADEMDKLQVIHATAANRIA